ncbi:MAG: glutamine synthetase family protein [Candidatus Bathyarchaeota archaeon]|nr:glutamine synthetase family protein [Candidatus Bathyarchaeota archaeon]MDH5532059.1 glutamine synthetase family protein [Candidatus Bathyarchaeota archaeon]MDH5712829.1 glutamine synthetase family protein [Candidatus Bathyarchaeota archaeon]
MDKETIVQKVKSEKIEFIDLMFSDLFGGLKNVTISPRELRDCLDSGKWFDGSSIEGFRRVHESDMLLIPDLSTYILLPWLRDGRNVARLICDVYEPDETPFAGDPRHILRRVQEKAKEKGYFYYVGPEIEFFLFRSKENRTYHDTAGYFDFSPRDFATDIRAVMASTLERLGINVEMTHHEVAPSQHEIDIEYSEALKMADEVMVLKQTIKTVANDNGLHATFMPKPIFGINGNGMHTHQSIFDKKGENLFYDKKDKYRLSPLAYHFMGGQLKHIRELAAVLCPTVNSYKRLVRGYEAPVYICWGQRNRSALIRVPRYSEGREKSTRLELRCPDPGCNPYLTFAVMLAAGLKGIEEEIESPDPVEEDVYGFDDSKLAKFYIKTLPANLGEAIEEFERSKLMRETLGEHVFNKYLEIKKTEWEEFQRSITDWELDRYKNL